MLGWLIRGLLFRTVLRRFWWVGLLLLGIGKLRGDAERANERRRYAGR